MLVNREKAMQLREKKSYLFAPYTGNKKMLLSYLDMLEKTNRIKKVVIYHYNPILLKSDFESLFVIVDAAGGLVENESGEILSIFRKEHWDLPKGKIDEGESKKQAAKREITEETGAQNLSIVRKLKKTRHFFRTKDGKRALKRSFWYFMRTNKQKLVPEEKEDITRADWKELDKLIGTTDPIYKNIKDLLKNFRKKRNKSKLIESN